MLTLCYFFAILVHLFVSKEAIIIMFYPVREVELRKFKLPKITLLIEAKQEFAPDLLAPNSVL